MNAPSFEGDLTWANATLLFLKAQCIVMEAGDSDTPALSQAKELLERCLLASDQGLGDVQLHIKSLVLLSDTLLILGNSAEAREYLGRAHKRVMLMGDECLELRVLRGLERCYVRMPHQALIAKASLKVKNSRERSIQGKIELARAVPDHRACVEWNLVE
mmetsp:Transcript_19719/g.28972  ORF Transcript_19719/g.28972 Transcript_19719/m.28972 type:complete len:160 (+) Transcript_19719:46-525(+)